MDPLAADSGWGGRPALVFGRDWGRNGGDGRTNRSPRGWRGGQPGHQALQGTIFGGLGIWGLPQGAAQQLLSGIGADMDNPHLGVGMDKLNPYFH